MTGEAFESSEVVFAGRLVEVPNEVDVAPGAGTGGVAQLQLPEDFGEQGLRALRGIDDEATATIPKGLEDEAVGNAVALDADEVDGSAGFPESRKAIGERGGLFREANEGIAAAGKVGQFTGEGAPGFLRARDDGGQRGERVPPCGGQRQRTSGLGLGIGACEVIDDEEDDA